MGRLVHNVGLSIQHLDVTRRPTLIDLMIYQETRQILELDGRSVGFICSVKEIHQV